jgi:hypothetical protein
MMNKAFLREDSGKISQVRIASLACVLTACAVAILAVVKDRNLLDAAFLCTGLIGAGLGCKVWQKGKENEQAINLDALVRKPSS